MTPDLAIRFNLHRAGRSWRGDCPACGYPDAFTLDVRDGRPLGWCASCQDQQAIGRLMAGVDDHWEPPTPTTPARDAERQQARREAALRLWAGSTTVLCTAADTYLAKRALPDLAASPALRFRGDCTHPAGGRYPALVALVVDAAGKPVAVHRTYLTSTGRKAKAEPIKATLGPFAGGAIRLHGAAPEIVVGEGIETAASAGLLLHLPAWAAVCAGNLAKLPLPDCVRAVAIAADPDVPGVDAANEAAERWRAEGRRVRIVCPKDIGQDFNDLLLSRMEADHAP
jgi:putative DNA primase/helicase